MELNDGRVTILAGDDGVSIEVFDHDAGVSFVEIKMTAEQWVMAMSRMGFTPCKVMQVRNFDKVGKKHECKQHTFKIPKSGYDMRDKKKQLHKIAKETCPKGWEPDLYFSSQSSFYKDGDQNFARTTIRRWV